MSALNKVMIIGNLGADPETVKLPSGDPVCNFRVAVSNRYKDRNGETQEQTEWVPVKAFNKLAETCQQFLGKGRKVYVEGRWSTDTWEDKTTGEKRSKVSIVAQNVQFLDSARETAGAGAGAGNSFDSMPF